MTRGIKVRLILFVILSAIGITYVSATYLGFVDRLLGRGMTLHATLPTSGGLFEGSEVTYRGVKIGKVDKMRVRAGGLTADLNIRDGVKVPTDTTISVHNLSAVGEQYLDLTPARREGPYLRDGDTLKGTADSVPLGEEVLLTDLSALVNSVDKQKLNTVVTELGALFRGNATPLRQLVDNGQAFIAAAQANQDATLRLIDRAAPMLQTQVDNRSNIQSFARDLADLSGALRASDADVRTVLHQAPGAAAEVRLLTEDLRQALPPLLAKMIPVSQTLSARLPGLEQLLVTFPRLIAAGPTALTEGEQKFGRVNLNLNQSPAACTDGYLPKDQRRAPSDTTFVPYYPAECRSGPPINMRGMKYAPPPTSSAGAPRSTGGAARGDGTSSPRASASSPQPDWVDMLTGSVS